MARSEVLSKIGDLITEVSAGSKVFDMDKEVDRIYRESTNTMTREQLEKFYIRQRLGSAANRNGYYAIVSGIYASADIMGVKGLEKVMNNLKTKNVGLYASIARFRKKIEEREQEQIPGQYAFDRDGKIYEEESVKDWLEGMMAQ